MLNLLILFLGNVWDSSFYGWVLNRLAYIVRKLLRINSRTGVY